MTLAYSPLYLPLLAWLFSLIGSALALTLLRSRRVMDVPNDRSNHAAPVPRGGGVAMITVALMFLPGAGLPPLVLAACFVLMIVSFVDDLRGLPVTLRLGVQLLAVATALYAIPGKLPLPHLPSAIELALTAFALLWYVNLTNFMDGIDGITSMQTIMTCLGILSLRILHPQLPEPLALVAGVLAAATLGFYAFNMPPAKLFMGDAGSVPLGLLTGMLLLILARNGYLASALILPAYYVTDATFTLLARWKRGEKLFEAHSSHAYQRAVRAGLSHRVVVCRITGLNILLVILSGYATLHPAIPCWLFVAAAYLLSLFLIRQFTHGTPAR